MLPSGDRQTDGRPLTSRLRLDAASVMSSLSTVFDALKAVDEKQAVILHQRPGQLEWMLDGFLL